MTEDTYTSLRRQFLSLGLTGAVIGTAGCSGMVNVDDQSESENDDGGTPSADIDAANFTFEYDSEAQSVEIIFNGGAGIVASNLQVRHGSGNEVIWAELGSTTAGPDEEISAGATALLGPNVLNWELPIAEDEMIRLVYVGKETPATLERYSPPESTDSETTVPASISSFSVENNSEQQLQITFTASQQLSTIQVNISGPETTTLSESEFTESQSGDGSYSYEATYEASSDGEFTATLEEAVDVNGSDSTNNQSISDSTTTSSEDTTPPSLSAFSIANQSEQQLRVSFDSDEQISTIQVNISGPESTSLTRSEFTETETGQATYTYEATYESDSDGEFTATLEQATDENGNNGADGRSVSVSIETGTNTSLGEEGVWPQAGYDAQSRSANPAGIPQRSAPTEQWVFETGWEVRGEPVVRGEELYFTSLDGNLYNLNATTGEEQWRYETSETGWTSPALWNELVLFTSARDNTLYAVDTDSGSLSWEFETGANIWRSPKVVEDTVYFGSGDQNLYAVDVESGTEQWRYSTDGGILSVPAVADNRVYFTSQDNNLYCVNQEDGSELWAVQASDQSDPLIGHPTVVGEIVVQSARGGPQRGYSVQDGSVQWETDVDAGGGNVHDGTLYYTASSQEGPTLRAVDPSTGDIQWTVDQAAAGNITGDVLYYSAQNGTFGAVDLESQSKLWESELSTDIKGSPIVVDEWVYLPGGDNNLYSYR